MSQLVDRRLKILFLALLALSFLAAAGAQAGVILEATYQGGSSGSTAVATTGPVTFNAARLYVAFVAPRSYRSVTDVSGMGGTWTQVGAQCGGRDVTGVEVWMTTSAVSSGAVSAALSGAPTNTAIVVAEYSGFDLAAPIGAVASANTNGVSGACSGGVDSDSYALPLTTTSPSSLVVGAIATRHGDHEPGAGWVEQLEVSQGTGSSQAGMAIEDQEIALPGPISVTGTSSVAVDWTAFAIEIKTVTGPPEPNISVSPPSVSFGPVGIGSPAEATVTVSNVGSEPLQVSGSSVTGDAPFSLVSGGGAVTLQPGQSQAVVVGFLPGTQASFSGLLTVSSDDPDEATVTVALSGDGALPVADVDVSPPSLDFGSVPAGSPADATVTVANVGSATLQVDSSSVAGDSEFSVTSGGGSVSVAAGGSHDVVVRFDPSGPGSFSGTLTVESDDPDEATVSVSLSGAGDSGFVRGPYLQTGTPTSVVVRWRTASASESVVRYGLASDQLLETASVPGSVTEHEVPLTGLEPDTVYYYGVGTSSGLTAGGNDDYFFVTAPTPGSRVPIRIWVVGDSGQCSATNGGAQGCIDATAVRDRYLEYAGADVAHVWLMLGDNAYASGSDSQYTRGLFEVYPPVLRNTVLWPVPGNHEFGASDSPSQSGPYYEAFTLPTQGEAGGVASGTEAYYSFDYGNVHFIALDSHDTSRSASGAMYAWLEADLMATNADWLIAIWHHPPYTKGSHDSDSSSDSGGRMVDMREIFLPLLEDYGLDLQLTGHSHSYERSVLLDNHYGTSSTFDPQEHAVDAGDGDPAGDGAYEKDTYGMGSHEGTVYSVVGSSSKLNSVAHHPVMVTWLKELGAMVIDIDGPSLEAVFIEDNGVIGDSFAIDKVPEPSAALMQIAAVGALVMIRRWRSASFQRR